MENIKDDLEGIPENNIENDFFKEKIKKWRDSIIASKYSEKEIMEKLCKTVERNDTQRKNYRLKVINDRIQSGIWDNSPICCICNKEDPQDEVCLNGKHTMCFKCRNTRDYTCIKCYPEKMGKVADNIVAYESRCVMCGVEKSNGLCRNKLHPMCWPCRLIKKCECKSCENYKENKLEDGISPNLVEENNEDKSSDNTSGKYKDGYVIKPNVYITKGFFNPSRPLFRIGLQPAQYFSHAEGGREAVIHTSMSTSG